MRAFLSTSENFATIFEDDVVLSRGLRRFFSEFDSKTCNLDILRIETFRDPLRLMEDNAISPFSMRRIMRSISFTGGAAGYVLSRRAAETLLREKDMFFKQSDRVMFNPFERLHSRLRMRHLVPALCVQTDRLVAGSMPNLRSDIAVAREGRQKLESPFLAARLLHMFFDVCRYEILAGLRKLSLQYVKGVRKMDVPFSDE